MSIRNRACGCICLAALLITLASTACDDRRRHQPSDPIQLSHSATTLPADASPKQVVEQLLTVLGEAQKTRSQGLGTKERKQAYDQAFARIFALASKRDVHEEMISGKSSSVPKDVTPEAALTVMAESWVSQLARYVDGIKFETIRVLPEKPQNDAVAYVEADALADHERLLEIDKFLSSNPPKNAAGQLFAPESPEFANTRREMALKSGLNPPTTTGVEIRLKKVEGSWKAIRIAFSPGGRFTRTSSAPTALPTAK